MFYKIRTNNVRLDITEPVNVNKNDKLKDASTKPVMQVVENVEKQEKVEKKPKRRESVPRCILNSITCSFSFNKLFVCN